MNEDGVRVAQALCSLAAVMCLHASVALLFLKLELIGHLETWSYPLVLLPLLPGAIFASIAGLLHCWAPDRTVVADKQQWPLFRKTPSSRSYDDKSVRYIIELLVPSRIAQFFQVDIFLRCLVCIAFVLCSVAAFLIQRSTRSGISDGSPCSGSCSSDLVSLAQAFVAIFVLRLVLEMLQTRRSYVQFHRLLTCVDEYRVTPNAKLLVELAQSYLATRSAVGFRQTKLASLPSRLLAFASLSLAVSGTFIARLFGCVRSQQHSDTRE